MLEFLTESRIVIVFGVIADREVVTPGYNVFLFNPKPRVVRILRAVSCYRVVL